MHPPGWYQDASVPGQERWWDGGAFTADVRPAVPSMPAYPVFAESEGKADGTAATPLFTPTGLSTVFARQRDSTVDLASGKNTHAIVALVSALLSLLGWPVACVSGFVFGVLGFRRARQYAAAGHPSRGWGMSLWALALSAVGTAVTVVALLAR